MIARPAAGARIGALPFSSALVGLLLLALGAFAAGAGGLARAAAAGEDVAVLVTESGPHPVAIEIADTVEARARGLMFRKSVPADHGMLFDFKTDQDVSFWMKNTPVSLDMIFVRADGSVVNVAEGTTPFSLAAVPSAAPVRFVLEVVAGTAKRIGLKAGDRLEHPRVGPS